MKGYILRWNPNISSWTYDMHERLIKDFVCDKSVGMNWSIFDFEELEIGDFFILQQVGTDNDGIAMVGTFISEPYTEASWKKKDGTNLFYADMEVDLIINRNNKKNKSLFSAEELQQKFSEIDWHKGHSGVLIPDEYLEKLVLDICYQIFLLKEKTENIRFATINELWQKACDYINYFCPDMRNKIIEKRQNDLIYKNYSDGEVIDKSLMDITFDNEKMNNKTHFNIDSFPDYLIPRA
jgi:hypothetical protein